MKKNIIIIILLFLVLLINSCSYKKVLAKKGILDLRDWNFDKEQIVTLDGEWEFYNNELLTPDDFKNLKTHFSYINMPGRWRNINNDRINIGRYGYATYKLKILLNEKISDLGLRIPIPYVAYTIWINDKYKFNQGIVARNIKDEIPMSYPQDFNFNVKNNEIEIIVQNSNFHDESGGFLNSFFLGKSERFIKYIKNKISFDLFLLGVILIFFIYNILLYLFHRKDISPLIFSVFCLTISIRLLFTNECFIYNIIPNFNFELARKLEYFAVTIGPSILIYFLYKQFPNYNIKKIVITSLVIGMFYTLVVMFTPVRIYSYLLKLFQIKILIDSIYIIYILIKAIFKKKIKAVISLISFIILLISIIFEILYHNKLFLIGKLVPTGLVIYIFGQSIILSLRFVIANSKLEFILNKLKTYSQELEIKVKERTKELEEANNQKINFFINFAHEIKTPLTLISNYYEKYIKKAGEFQETFIIRKNLDKLTRDMVNILDIEKLAKGQVYYDHSMIINLSNILIEKISLFKEMADKKNIKIYESIKKNIHIKIDTFAIDRILNNLLDNAIKYNKENGEINVILKANKKNVILIIKDTGIGIDKEQQNNIFDPYYQLSHHKRNIQGIGIGLSIVKKIIDEIHGELNIKSDLNKGTVFTIKFKGYNLKQNDIINTSYKVSKPINTSLYIELDSLKYKKNKYNIFVVEDNIELLLLLKDTISEKYNYYYAFNGKDALEKLKNIPKPDIIISDIMMDEMDGYDFIENINKMEDYRSIPFIFLTVKDMIEDKIKGLTMGAIDFVNKPFSIEIIMSKIEALIKFQEINKVIIEKNISNDLYNYLRKDFASLKNLQNKRIKSEYDFLGKLYVKYGITQKEMEIINLLRQGFEYKEIGTSLNISINTVRTCIKRIFKKINVNSIKQLIKVISNTNLKIN